MKKIKSIDIINRALHFSKNKKKASGKLKKKVKLIIKKIIYPNKYSSEAYVDYLRKKGCKIGKDTYIYSPNTVIIDETRPNFIEIGEGVHITGNVIILAHDYSFAILRKVYHCMPQRDKLTKIGNNVFIGMNSIILMGTTIGDNCIIGAGSVVRGNVPSGTIWAGNPARQIGTIKEYYEKLANDFEKNAQFFAKRKYETLGKIPDIDDMAFYKVLLFDKNEENKRKYLETMKFNGDNKEKAIEDLMKIERKYTSVDELINKNCNEW